MFYEKDTSYQGIPTYHYTIPASKVFNSSLRENFGFCTKTPLSRVRYFDSQPQPQNGSFCLSSGLLDLSGCQPGRPFFRNRLVLAFFISVGVFSGNPPVVVSFPHFLYCEKDVMDSVSGLRPNFRDYGSAVDLEPVGFGGNLNFEMCTMLFASQTTGVGTKFTRKLQINVAMRRFDYML